MLDSTKSLGQANLKTYETIANVQDVTPLGEKPDVSLVLEKPLFNRLTFFMGNNT